MRDERIQAHPEDVPLSGTSSDYRGFIEGPIWFDMKNNLQERIELARNDLEKAATLDEVRLRQGEITTLRLMLDLPNVLYLEAQSSNPTD